MGRIAIIACVLTLSAFTAQSQLILRDEAWTQDTRALAHALTHAPHECLARTDDDIELGRALFRSPTLLGGPVARIGISCNSCHANGRANAHFFLPELTNRPGAADVTSEWASAVRGDGVMNPRTIPDLTNVGSKTTFGSDGETSLARFTHSVIVEEFQGAEPPPRAMQALLAYLNALRTESCPRGETRLTLADAASDVRRARAAALRAAEANDRPAAELAIQAAQDSIGRIVERLPHPAFLAERRVLDASARALTRARSAPDLSAALRDPAWSGRFDALILKLQPREHETYFAAAPLAAALARR